MSSRINRYLALATGMSRRAADQAIAEGRVAINGRPAGVGTLVNDQDKVTLDDQSLAIKDTATIMLNKPVGYVCSRSGQGSQTVYELIPPELHDLKPVGRLDKQSSGLLLMTNDGQLANRLAHPRYAKTKVYQVKIDKALQRQHQAMISGQGVKLADGLSRLRLSKLDSGGREWQVTMSEGRNRQIRRTFASLGYKIKLLDRIRFGDYQLQQLTRGAWRRL